MRVYTCNSCGATKFYASRFGTVVTFCPACKSSEITGTYDYYMTAAVITVGIIGFLIGWFLK